MPGLTELLYAESDGAPPSGVDLAKIMKSGRLRRLRRQLVVPGAAAAMVLALAAGILVARGPDAAPQRGAEPSPTPSATATAGGPAAFSPLRQHLAVGWVPDGLAPLPPQLSQLAQRVRFSEGLVSDVGLTYGRWVDVTLYAAGVTPPDMVDHGIAELASQLVPADPVNGGAAQWITFKRRSPKGLAWRWAPDAWAVVRYDAAAPNGGLVAVPADQEAVERRIAESVRTDVDAPIAVPFTVATPTGMHLVQLDQEGGRVALLVGHAPEPYRRAELAFRPDDLTQLTRPIDQWVGLPGQPALLTPVLVTVEWQVAQSRIKPEPDRTIAGHPAAVLGFQPGYASSVTIYDVDGYTVTVGMPAEAPLNLDQAIQLALSVQILGPPTDSSQWTDSPIR